MLIEKNPRTVDKAMIGLLLAILILGFEGRAFGSATEVTPYTRVSWTIKDGLPASSVWSITEDREGFLWLGTNRGLARFDGVRFVPWEPPDGSLFPNTGVVSLCADRDGGLWLSWGGMPRVDHISDGRIQTFGPTDGLADSPAFALLQDSDGVIWATGRRGVSKFEAGHWEHVRLPAEDLETRSLYEDRAGNLWVQTSGGVFRRRRGAKDFALMDPSSRLFTGFGEDQNGAVWVVDRSLRFRNLSTGKTVSFARKDSIKVLTQEEQFARVASDRRGRMWVATLENGLLRFDTLAERSRGQQPVENGFVGNTVRSNLFEDRTDNLWVGTEEGLTRLSEGRISTLAVPDRPLNSLTRAVTVDNRGIVWLGTGSGLMTFAPDRTLLGSVGDLRYTSVTALQADQRGTVWIGNDRGLARYANGQLSYVRSVGQLDQISAITTDKDGGVWICDRNRGVFRWHEDTLTAFNTVPELARRPVAAIYADSRDRIWFGLFSGVVVVRDGDRFRSYTPADGVPGGSVVGFFEDAGVIWIAAANGLSRYDGETLKAVVNRSKLPGDVSTVLEDDDGFIWLGVSRGVIGIHRDDLRRATIQTVLPYDIYDTSDGLQGDPLFGRGYPNAARDRNGTLWFVTTAGVALVNPQRLVEPETPPRVKIERVVVNGKPFTPTASLRLPRTVSELQIEYTAPYLRAPARVRFRYRLDGVDETWVENDTDRRASYTKLAPGDYRFAVISSADRSNWSTPAVLSLHVPAAFYQTSWFYAFCIGLGGTGLWGAWRVRTWRIHHRYSLVFLERSRVAREIHDTLLQSLVGLSLHLDNLSDELASAPSADAVKDQLQRIRRRVDHYVVEARQSIWDLRSPTLEGTDLVTALRESGERIIEDTMILFDVEVHGSPKSCSRTFEQQLLRIAQESMTNAVRHGSPHRIHVDVRYDEGSINLRIFDDGSGFTPNDSSRQTEHCGLAILRERAQQIGGLATIASAPGAGTTIDVSAPLTP